MEAVAARAGVSKAALYRRWPSKEPLVVDAIIESGWNALPPEAPTSGDLHSDLTHIIGSETARASTAKMRVLNGALSAIGQSPTLRHAVTQALIEPRSAATRRALQHALDRGEIPAQTDIELFSSVLPALLTYRLLITDQPVSRPWQYQVIDSLILAALKRPDPGALIDAASPQPATGHTRSRPRNTRSAQ